MKKYMNVQNNHSYVLSYLERIPRLLKSRMNRKVMGTFILNKEKWLFIIILLAVAISFIVVEILI